MDIVIIAQYLRNIESFEGNNSRFVYLAKMLSSEQNNQVEIITSDFNHATKKNFDSVGKLENVQVTALHEPGYPKNVCLKRFSSHKKLAVNIEKYLGERKKPDVIYVAVPSLSVAEAAATYCRKNNVRFIVDIQDLWPEAFKMVFNVPVLSDLIFKPMEKQADKIYATADQIVAVSKTYAERGMRVNKKCKESVAVFLGTELETFDGYARLAPAEKYEGITIGYVGSMSASYDLISVIDAISQLRSDVPVRLLAMGDGADRERFINYAEQKGIVSEFTGTLPYPEMVGRLVACDIAVNPIHKGSAGSIINKVGDYAMAGLPVINTQESSEYRELLDTYCAGINCECENAEDMAKALQKLIDDGSLRTLMAENSRKLGAERFNRGNAYTEIINSILTKSEE